MPESGEISGSRRKQQGFSTNLPSRRLSKLPPCWIKSPTAHILRENPLQVACASGVTWVSRLFIAHAIDQMA